MKNEMNELGMNDEQRLHALLCAYVLGELEADERAEIESELAKSETLRAEQARLEATIGVVSGALREGTGNALSADATAVLEAAITRRPAPAAWYRNSVFRAAAALAVVAGGFALWRASHSLTPESEVRMAKLDVADDVAATGGRGQTSDKAPAEKEPLAGSDLPASKSDAQDPRAAEPVTLPAASIVGTPGAPQADNERAAGNVDHGNEVVGEDFYALDQDVEVAGVARKQLEEQVRRFAEQPAPLAETRKDSFVGAITLPPAETAAVDGRSALRLELESGSKKVELRRGETAPGAPSPTPAAPGGPSTPGPLAAGRSGDGGGAYRGPGDASAAGKLRERQGAGDAADVGGLDALGELGYLGEEEDAEEPVLRDGLTGADFDETRKAAGSDDSFFERAKRIDDRRLLEQRRLQLLERSCRMRPDERPRDMFFRFWGDNPFEYAALDQLSTFSVDVDTASYTLARNYLVRGTLPSKEQIRTEEFINYFKGDVPAPVEGVFNVTLELAPSLFGNVADTGSTDTWMLRVGLRGREVQKAERMPLALTFVVDVSGSMRQESRLELVKHALRMLVGQLDARDTISIVTFSNDARLVLPATSAGQKDLIEAALYPLQPQQSTNTEAGLRMGYAQAAASLTQGSQNRVVLLTDGVANVGVTDPDALVKMVESQRKQGILLNTVGVGMGNHNDNLLEQLADKGDGLCNYVDDQAEVKRALVDNFTGTFETIARDVKIQVQFDPAQVERYRLLGYENRAIADADFRNDKVDAGEVGAGHQVVALYEIVRRGDANPDGPLATARVRYKEPYRQGVADRFEETPAHEIERSITARQAVGGFAHTSAGYRRSVLVGQFAEFLRRSVHARHDSLDRLIEEASKLASAMEDKDFSEFVDMVKKSRELVVAELQRRDWFDDCGDLIQHNCYLRQQIEELRRRLGEERRLDELESRSRDLERRMDELRRRIENAEYELDPALVPGLQRENIELQRQLLDLLDRLRREGK